jgi:hypothetical protein
MQEEVDSYPDNQQSHLYTHDHHSTEVRKGVVSICDHCVVWRLMIGIKRGTMRATPREFRGKNYMG